MSVPPLPAAEPNLAREGAPLGRIARGDPAGRLAGGVAAITGASTGIGAGVARLFVEAGARVALMARDAGRLERTLDDIGRPDRVLAVPGDVGRRADAERFIDATVERFGRIDVLVSNAGIHREASFLDTSDSEFDEVVGTNLRGAFLVCRAAARRMVEQGSGGAIVVVASTNSFVAEPHMTAYNVSKAGLLLLVGSMAVDLAVHGIRVNAVAPGTILSEITRPMVDAGHAFGAIPLGRIGEPADIAWPILFLASDEAAYITGATLVVDGGQLAINGDPPGIA